MAMAPPSFADGVVANATNIDAVLTELEKANGSLDESYLAGSNTVPKRAVRRGAMTRSARNASNQTQKFTVGPGADLQQTSQLFPAGGIVGLDLTAGRWLCVVNTVVRGDPETTRLMWRDSRIGAIADWQLAAATTAGDATENHRHGTFLQVVTITENSHVRFGVRVTYPTVAEFELSRVAISVTAFRSRA